MAIICIQLRQKSIYACLFLEDELSVSLSNLRHVGLL